MPSDYRAIHSDNERRYGTDIGRIGPMLLANRYDDRTHFIYELLQNAEDALARRRTWPGSRAVTFRLTGTELRASHFGEPFNEADVRGICGIAEGKKDLTAIGRFGIGFKSVYAFTDRPEIHSGSEDFAIDNFVWPAAAPPVGRDPEETVIRIPLRPSSEVDSSEIARGLGRIGASTLLFLRQVEEIRWSLDKGGSSFFLRETEDLDKGVRRVAVVGQTLQEEETDESWLVFSEPAISDAGTEVGFVEIAFSIARDGGNGGQKARRIERSPLAVFFPTVLETHLGFLVQGPYRTTPSRDNVPKDDSWNVQLVEATGSLLVDALRWLRDHELLETAALRCLPIDPSKFDESNMLTGLFEATKAALSSEPLLPLYGRGHGPASRALIARTQELRELFNAGQLAMLYKERPEASWLSADITQDRTPELRRYLMQELAVPEVTPEAIIRRLDNAFLESQPDAWIEDLYGFLNQQTFLRRIPDDLPLVRLENGSHVPAKTNGEVQAFLPGRVPTDFPTVRAAVCGSDAAREFLVSLGLAEPNPVDDVVRNVLPRYFGEEFSVSPADYEADLERILSAFATDSRGEQETLVTALKEALFVQAVDAGDGTKSMSKPGNVYLATDRLKEIFAGVRGVRLLDDTVSSLRGEDARALLEACGATRYLQPVRVECDIPPKQLLGIRVQAGLERATWQRAILDVFLRGLDGILELLPQLDPGERKKRSGLIWEALIDLETRRGSKVFSTEYAWGYSQETKSASIDASFVRRLNGSDWVPDESGSLRRPELVLFDTLAWRASPFLQSKIRFRAPLIEELAREAGIEPGVIDLLKSLGITEEAELRERLGVRDGISDVGPVSPGRLEGEPQGTDGRSAGSSGDLPGATDSQAVAPAGDETVSKSARVFISYVAANPREEEPDPDGLTHAARMALEEAAISFILAHEPLWQRTPANNPGYDMYQVDESGQPYRWCEVKAMAGTLQARPVGLSRTQFEFADARRESYWLYVVERAGQEAPHIVRIKNPAGHSKTFTFDRGWLAIAESLDDTG